MDWGDAIALAALGLSGWATFAQVRTERAGKRPVLSTVAERATANTPGYGMFDLKITTFAPNSHQRVEIRRVTVEQPAGAILVSHLWNYQAPISIKPWEPAPRLTEAPERDELKFFDIEFARAGNGTPEKPLVVEGVIIVDADIKQVSLKIDYTSPTLGGFKGSLRQDVELREIDLFG